MKSKFYNVLTLGVACLLGLGGAAMLGTNASKEANHIEVHADDHTHNDTTFSEWTSTDSLPSSGSYYLTSDVTISSTWQPATNTKLCLNGHGIIMTGTGNVIQVRAAGNLYIYDCNKTITHKYKIDETGLATVNDAYESDFETFVGGYITGGKGVSTGGAIYLPGGSSKGNTTKLYMYGGTIIGNKTTGNGGAINYTYKKNMNSEMDIRDTLIMGNVADGNSGGIFHHANNRSLTLVNTKILKNVAASRPAGLFEQAQLKVQGDSYIYENRLKNGSPSDISVNHSGQTDTFTITGPLSQNAKFGLDDIRRSAIYNYFSYNEEGIPNEVFLSNSNKLVRRDGNNVVYNDVTPTGYSGDYDGQPHSISLALDDDSIDHTIKYGLTEGTYDLDTNPEFTLPGDYTVYYKVTMGLNTHKNSSKVTINALPVDYTAPTAKDNLHYNGEVQALVNAGSVTNGTMYYKVDDGDWSTDVASALSTGTYTVSYKVVGDPGYEDVDPASFQVSISPNDKSDLIDKILEKKDYCDSIKDQYPGVANLLDEAIKNAEAVRDDDNKTVQEIADAVSALDTAATNAADRIVKVNEVIADINAIGEVTLEKEALISAARTAYDSLVDGAKLDVTNYQVLVDSEIALQHIKDQIEAGKVKTLINEIGEVEYTSQSKGKIDAARTAYNALTADQKALISEQEYKVLTDAEAEYAALKADHDAADAVKALIDAIGNVEYSDACKAKIDAARTAYDALTADQKALISEQEYKVLTDAEAEYAALKADHDAADAVKALINAIGEVTLDKEDEIVAARTAYDALSTGRKDLVDNYDVLVAAEATLAQLKADKAAAQQVINLINEIGDVVYTSQCKDKIDAARSAYDNLTAGQKAFVANYEVLTDAEDVYASLKADHDAADAVKALIDAIGNVEYSDACKAKIDAANNAYEALTEEQKELVTNKKTLFDAIEQYDLLAHQPTVVDNGVAVKGKDGDLIPTNVTVKVEIKTSVQAQEGTTEYNNIQKAIGNDQRIVGVYDVKLIQNIGGVEKEIQPSDIKEGMIIVVEITLPDGLDVEGLKILHIHSESDIAFVNNYKIEGNKVSFETSKLSEFAFVTPAPKTGLPGWGIALIIIGAILLLVCGAYLLMMFVFNKWIKENDKAIRAFKLFGIKKDGKFIVWGFSFKFVTRVEEEIFKTKQDALK